MTKQEIEKVITRYTRSKMIILTMLIFALVIFCIGVIFYNDNFVSGILYLIMIFIVGIVYAFPLNVALSKKVDVKDFAGILEYLTDISDEMGKQKYFNGLAMIKNTLDEIVHYKMIGEDRYLKDCICYLQGKFHSGDDNCIPAILFERSYIRNISYELQQQINNKLFNAKNLEAIQCQKEIKEKRRRFISAQGICNIILGCIVTYKIIVTTNSALYHDERFLDRFVYNTGADIIACMSVLVSLIQSKRK